MRTPLPSFATKDSSSFDTNKLSSSLIVSIAASVLCGGEGKWYGSFDRCGWRLFFLQLFLVHNRLFLRMVFNRKYFTFSAFLFVTEVLIALYVTDGIIRPYVGDFLVVMLIYCAVKTFFNLSPLTVAAGTLLFSYILETFQYFHVVDRLGLQHNTLARTVIGYGFDWLDLVAYTLGMASVLFLEKRRLKKSVSCHLDKPNDFQ